MQEDIGYIDLIFKNISITIPYVVFVFYKKLMQTRYTCNLSVFSVLFSHHFGICSYVISTMEYSQFVSILFNWFHYVRIGDAYNSPQVIITKAYIFKPYNFKKSSANFKQHHIEILNHRLKGSVIASHFCVIFITYSKKNEYGC